MSAPACGQKAAKRGEIGLETGFVSRQSLRLKGKVRRREYSYPTIQSDGEN